MPAWRHRIPILGLGVIGIIAAFFGTFEDMVTIWWTSSTFNHCFLILPIALYLGFQRRDVLRVTAPSTSFTGCLFAFANGVLWVAGELVSIAFFKHLAVVGMLIGVSWAMIGNRVLRILLFPFAYLYFAVPEGEALVPYLQDWTAAVLVTALRLTDIPVFLEGRYLMIPSGNFVVAEACSGINYLIATLAVATMFMYLRFHSFWRRVAFMALAIVVPLVANGLRAYGIVMIAHLSDYRHAMGVDHFIYGWVFFGIVIFALFALGDLFSDDRSAEHSKTSEIVPPGPARPLRTGAMLALAFVAALSPRGMLAALDSTRPVAAPIELASATAWQGPVAVEPALGTTFAGADVYLAGRYSRDDGREVIVEAVQYRAYDPGEELVNQSHERFDDLRWRQIAHRSLTPDRSLPLGDVTELELRSMTDGERYVLWHWYETPFSRSAGQLQTKLGEGRARLTGEAAGGAFVTVRTREDDIEQARAVLEAFVRSGAVPLVGEAR